MWSEGDQQYSQWALNPSAYQDVSHEQVDWAALAQQWIQMKDTCPADQMPAAPPPPPLGRPDDKFKSSEIEGGEAPMEMDKEETPSSSSSQEPPPSWNGPGPWNNNWPQQWGAWGWGSAGGPPGGVPPPNPAAVLTKQTTAVPVPGYGYSTSTPGFVPPATGFAFNPNSPASGTEFNQVMVGGYWTAGPHAANNASGGPGSGMAPFIRSNRPEWSKRNDRSHERSHSMDKSDDEEDSMLALDAAKRRQLPAWIREGLEKMEREKQRKIDRDVQMREREIYLQKKKEEEDLLMTEMENNGEPRLPKKSKFESDSDESDTGDVASPALPISSKKKSRFRNASSPAASPHRALVKVPEPQLIKSREEMMQDTMLKVRRMLTEILLEVTTEEMEAVAHEVLAKAKAKAPALDLRKTPAFASLTGQLGLGIYGESDDENSDGGDNAASSDTDDSDRELQEQIERRKTEFALTEREIEARLREEEEREKEHERRMAADRREEGQGEERQVETNQSDKRLIASDGTRVKSEPDDHGRQHFDYQMVQEQLLVGKDATHSKVKKEVKCELISGVRGDKRAGVAKAEPVKVKQEKSSSDEEDEESTGGSDSDSSSSSKSSSSAVKTSSSDSKRGAKRRYKNGHSKERTKKSLRKQRGISDEKRTKKSTEKASGKSKSKSLDSKEAKARDKKRERRDRSPSKEKRSRRSASRDRSRDDRRRKRSRSRERKKSRRSRSKESRRSRRSHSRESHRSKSDRRNSDRRRGGDSHRSRDSRSKERTSNKSRDSRSKERSSHKSSSRRDRASEKASKRSRRDSSGSESSESGSARREKRARRGGRYSRCRSTSERATGRRDSSASSSPAAKGKAAH